MIQTFDQGARGYLVAEMQHALQVAIGRPLIGGIDGKYGEDVKRGVIEWANAQVNPNVKAEMQRQRALFGQAGPLVWESLGLQWPDMFSRCLLLTAAFEGTGFTGSAGPRETADNAGVTYGIIGFTSYNGELQELLRELKKSEPEIFENIAKGPFKSHLEYCNFLETIEEGADPYTLERFALNNGVVKSNIADYLSGLGETVAMKRLQMEWASERYGKRAQKQVKALFGDNYSERAYALLYDIAVQNGGLKTQEISDLQHRFMNDPGMPDSEKMFAISTRLIERLRNDRRSTRIIEDVRSRKSTIARGTGVVHKTNFALRSYAL